MVEVLPYTSPQPVQKESCNERNALRLRVEAQLHVLLKE